MQEHFPVLKYRGIEESAFWIFTHFHKIFSSRKTALSSGHGASSGCGWSTRAERLRIRCNKQ